MSDVIEFGEAVERHVMAFTNVDVEVNVDGEGNAWVNFNQGGEPVASFTLENFADVAAFVERNARGEARPVTDADRAFALWCAEENLVEDETAPHGQAFYAGYQAGAEDEYHAYLRSTVT